MDGARDLPPETSASAGARGELTSADLARFSSEHRRHVTRLIVLGVFCVVLAALMVSYARYSGSPLVSDSAGIPGWAYENCWDCLDEMGCFPKANHPCVDDRSYVHTCAAVTSHGCATAVVTTCQTTCAVFAKRCWGGVSADPCATR